MVAFLPTPDGIIRADLSPKGIRARACARAGQNFNDVTWAQYFPGEDYRRTCRRFDEPPPTG